MIAYDARVSPSKAGPKRDRQPVHRVAGIGIGIGMAARRSTVSRRHCPSRRSA